MNDQTMAGIAARWGSLIEIVCANSSIPPAFLAALIANESAGNVGAQRFEPAIFNRIQKVLTTQGITFAVPGIQHTLRREEFLAFINPADLAPSTIAATSVPKYSFCEALTRMEWLATSWGLTQIMGWHTVEFAKQWKLDDPREGLMFTIALLAYFASRYQLDLKKDFEDLFRCWNTGKPSGKTFDPEYVANGIARMAEYNSLVQEKTA